MAVQNVVIPIDLVTQQAEAPIKIPGQGGTHAIVVMPGGRTVLAASGSTIVPVDAATRQVGTPLDLGPGHTIFGMALDPASPTLYALVAGGVFPVDTANATAGVEIPTGLSVSSVYSPHGIAGHRRRRPPSTWWGRGGPTSAGGSSPSSPPPGATETPTGFDRYGIADPAAVAVWPRRLAAAGGRLGQQLGQPAPADHLRRSAGPGPAAPASAGVASGTGHPTDIVFGPGRTGAFVVDGFDAVIPYQPASQTFGRPIPVCSGASSMAVAPAP